LNSDTRLRVCAVSYLNTVPLVWGLLRGPLQGAVDLTFSLPSVCADRLESGDVDIGIVPCAELDRLSLDFLPDTGIACKGAVRSILLTTKVPPRRIRTLAVDTSSRTSVLLARIILAERYGSTPTLIPMQPDLHSMLAEADAALIIGDPALRLDPARLQYQVLDLGSEWLALSGLPMVFAVWAGKAACLTAEVRSMFRASCLYGLDRLDEIISDPEATRGFPPEVVHEYLTRYIHFELGPAELEGLAAYRRLVAEYRLRDAGLLTPCYSE
jgi:predicted solute-binding protein